VIVRTWEGRVRPGMADQYVEHLTAHVLPEIRALPGHRGARVLRGVGEASDDFMVLTFWSDVASIEAFAGPDIGHSVVPEEARAVLTEYDERARHFEVVVDEAGRVV